MKHIRPGTGKFECEPCYTREMWETVLDGGADDEDGLDDEDTLASVVVTPDHVRRYPCCLSAADVGKRVYLVETDHGFIETWIVP